MVKVAATDARNPFMVVSAERSALICGYTASRGKRQLLTQL